MDIIWLIVIILISAFVGGGTNVIAIRMLFRPHEAIFIGPYKLPFTPGLIPKRREQIATQLGKMVEEHLVTPEGIAQKIFQQTFIDELSNRAAAMLHIFLEQNIVLNDWLKVHISEPWSTKEAREAFEMSIRNKVMSIAEEKQHQRIEELLPEEWKEKSEAYIPIVSRKLLERVENYLHTPEGQSQIDRMVTQFFATKGNVGGLFGRMLQRVSLSEIVSKELTRLLHEEKTVEMLNQLLRKEWEAVLEKTPREFVSIEVLEDKVNRLIHTIASGSPIIGEWEKPLNQWAVRYETVIINSFFPVIIKNLTQLGQRHLKSAMKHLGIQEIVRQQINSFPLQRIEAMLLSIAGRELKMIALLGAIIGGVIGFFQGLIFLFLL